ncbi:Gfo/Idh/MocA family protein [Cryptosporangium aurantiacum]|uniref:Predicted dehydrogenase n=1 Tax=Cryptosporangium aurantiacum TaxID=134849 RepID=A0A1M7P7D3_9ACTN|nr:Gfo/Idh/MocA family oxidoreductase [Cryptosporangium aurantiacum]SHN12577.1 Predicted dehydrogenase [Cryptosporangium aurantiacum]
MTRIVPDQPVRHRGFGIGAVGAGFIMADVQLDAYARAGFPVKAIASRTRANAEQVAKRWNIPTVHGSIEELLADPSVEILDVAFPPHLQPDVIRAALRHDHIRGILAQKPLALNLADATALVAEVEAAGKVMSVNQNMRYDQSIRAVKQLIDAGELGEIVTASVDMRAVPHWQPFLCDYDRLTIANMSVHHLDALRFLFGEPLDVYTAVRPDPRTEFAHSDGIVASVLRFTGGVLATSIEDVWGGPVKEGCEGDVAIRWRVEGTRGLATGTLGWPEFPDGSPSTLRYSTLESGGWVTPEWSTRWFPDAFGGVMEQLQYALATGAEPALPARDNLRTMALIEACYRSIEERRAVSPSEFHEGVA